MSLRLQQTWILAFACVFPTFLTLAYFQWLAGGSSGVRQACYSVGKLIQFSVPAFWVFIVLRQKWRPKCAKFAAVLQGVAFGVLVAAGMFAIYFLWMKPAGLLVTLEQEVTLRMGDMGIDTPLKFAVLGLFYAVCHSWLEEYYWRWFVFLHLETAVGLHWAVGISSFAFMGHHAVLLGAYFQWAVLPTVFFTACVGAGGAFWALLYHRADSLLSPWLSHMLVDAAIFLIGFDLVRPK